MEVIMSLVENLPKYQQKLENKIIDPDLIDDCAEICNLYFQHDPLITLEQAQQAAVILMTALRLTDSQVNMHSGQDQIVIEWLTQLKINTETLEVIQ